MAVRPLANDRIIPLAFKVLLGALVVLTAAVGLLFYLTRRDPRIAAARADLAELQRAVEQYRAQHGRPPASLLELFASPAPYLPPLDRRRDPWGHLYQYSLPGKVWSMGPDGWDHTADDVYP